MTAKRKNKTGPSPKVLRIDGDWQDAVKKMLSGGSSAAEPKKKAAKKKRNADGA